MSLDAFLVLPVRGGSNASKSHIANFEWDAEFEFLTPFWPQDATGSAVDLYGDALFRGADLVHLREALRNADEALKLKPERWQERIGWTSPDRTQPIYGTAVKSAIGAKIERLLAAILAAEHSGGAIEFVGD
jgi:hypothetical protein